MKNKDTVTRKYCVDCGELLLEFDGYLDKDNKLQQGDVIFNHPNWVRDVDGKKRCDDCRKKRVEAINKNHGQKTRI